jgi:FAD/FMN-containing dehydrogenase
MVARNHCVNLVKPQAGIRLIDLCNELAKHGVALANVPSVLEQSIAGAISTGTHGSGLTHGTTEGSMPLVLLLSTPATAVFAGSLSSMVEAVTIITAAGEIIKASRSVNMDVYEAARLGLGAIGIVTEVTIRVVPAFGVKSFQYIADTEWAFNNLLQLATEHEFFKVPTLWVRLA